METPRVYLDTTVLKFSATALRRYVPKKRKLYLGANIPEVQAYDIGLVNPNAFLTGEIKTEAELLTFPYRDFSEYACGLADGTP